MRSVKECHDLSRAETKGFPQSVDNRVENYTCVIHKASAHPGVGRHVSGI